jgi:hypothetical protein
MLNLKTYLGNESFDSLPDTLTNDISADGVGATFGIPENLIVDADGGEQSNETTGVIQEGAGVAEGDPLAAGVPPEGQDDFPFVDPRQDSEEELAEEEAYLEDEQRSEELGEAQSTLEAYVGLLKQAGSKGISKQSAAFMAVGMKRVDRILGDKKSLGLEAFDATPRSAASNTTVSLEDLKEKLAEAGKKIVEIFQALREKFAAWYEKFFSKTDAVLQKAVAVDKAAAAPEEEGAKGKPSSIPAHGRNVMFAKGDELSDMAGETAVVGWLSGTYLPAMKKFGDSLKSSIMAANADNLNSSYGQEALEKAVSAAGLGEVPGDVMGGGFTLGELVNGVGISLNTDNYNQGPSEIAVLSHAEILAANKKIKALVKAVGESRSTTGFINTMLKELGDAFAKKEGELTMRFGKENRAPQELTDGISSLGKALTALSPNGLRHVFDHCVHVADEQLAMFGAMLSRKELTE